MARARLLRLILSLALASIAVILGGVSVVRKVADFQPLGFEGASPNGSSIQVQTVSAPQTGLRPGDQIVLVNGGDVRSLASVAQRLREGVKANLVVQRDGEPLTVTYRRPPLAPDWPYLILALVGVAYLGIGLYTLLRQGGGQSLLFYLWCFVSATLYLLTATPPVDAGFILIDLVDTAALVLLPAITLHFFLVFPVPLPIDSIPGLGALGRKASLRRLLPFVYLPASVLLTLGLDLRLAGGRFFFGRPTEASIHLLDRLQMGHFGLLMLASVLLLVFRLRRETGWEQHRQMQWVALGLGFGYAPFLLLYGLPIVLSFHPATAVTALSVVPLAIVPLSFAYAILRYKLWDIEVVVRDTISSTLTLLLGIIGFALVNMAIGRGVSEELALARNLLTFLSGLGIAAMLVPARVTISSALERVHYRGSFGKRRALAGFGPELLHDRDLSGLCDALVRRLEEGIEIPLAALYLAQAAPGESLIAVRGPAGLPARLSQRAFGESFWGKEFGRLYGLSLPTEPLDEATILFALGFRYAFPLAVRGRAVGAVVCGFKRDQLPLSSEDVELIRSFLDPASLALENAQLLTELQDQLLHVQRLQDYSAGIFESSPAGIAVLDGERRLISANSAFARMAKREPSDLLHRDLASVLPVQPLPAPGEGPIEVSFCEPDGRERHFQLSLAAFEDAERSGLSVLVVHDVSERVAMENALRDRERLAALGVLAAGVAHEVNTPITGISSYAQMLLSDTPEDDPRHELLKKVERQTFRAARIVNNLLEYARDRPREQRPLDPVPLLSEALDLLSERFSKRKIELSWNPPTAPVLVLGCDGELQQVFTNLIVNALDAVPERGRLEIDVTSDVRTLRLRFADTGMGIPPEKLAAIFQPFYSTKLNRGGTGLGLAISHDIVRRHGGELKAESRPGEGACFTIELPLLSESLAGDRPA